MAITPVRWGILGAAKIAREQVIPGLMKSPWCEVVGLASRSDATARETAAGFGIARAYGSYEDLLDDPDIEAVYVPVPNHLHVELALAALKKGKHVLCEKPVALAAREAEALRGKTDHVLFAEGFMVRHHPQWAIVRDLIRQGAIGSLRAVGVSLTISNDDPENVRNNAAFGGGAVYDLGCYAVVSGRYFFEAEPARVMMLEDRDPRFNVDRLAGALLDYGDGRHQTFTVGMQNGASQSLRLIGSKGVIEMEQPYIPNDSTAPVVSLTTSLGLDDIERAAVMVPAADQYECEVTHFSKAIRGEAQNAFGVDDAIKQMKVLDALFASARSGGWERV
jgi:predicted dehydrogenase